MLSTLASRIMSSTSSVSLGVGGSIWSIVAAIRGQRPVDHDAAAKSVWEANPEELEAAAEPVGDGVK